MIIYGFTLRRLLPFHILKRQGEEIEKILKKDLPKIIVLLPDDSPEFVVTGNSLGKCGNMEYCKGGKLVFPKSKYDELVEILIQGFMDPIKCYYIFSTSSASYYLDKYRLTRRKMETIRVVKVKTQKFYY